MKLTNIFVAVMIACIFPVSAMAESKPDRRSTTDAFDDWVINCIEQDKNKACEMKQSLLNANQQLVAVLSMAKKPDGNMLFQIALPHLLDLTQPVRISIDDKLQSSHPFNFCNKTACFVIPADNDGLLKAFRKGNSGQIQSVTITGEPLVLGFSLKGFSAAQESLQTR